MESIHSLGGKARWKGISKKKRSEIMKAVSKARLTKKKKRVVSKSYTHNVLAR